MRLLKILNVNGAPLNFIYRWKVVRNPVANGQYLLTWGYLVYGVEDPR
jgi:hypothetical protein